MPASAQIVTDGTLGPAGPLTGPSFVIDEALGTRTGTNLFHSFSELNVRAGESATFTANGATTNVIGRVTGTGASTIAGVLRSQIPGADLWLLNPNGIVFGAGAALDVQGGFHATTADTLVLGGGGRFDATRVADTVLTTANPTAFGFLDASIGAITVNNATLAVPSGRSLSLVGGTLDLTNARLTAPGGTIDLQSAAGAGRVSLQGRTPPGTATTAFGNVTIRGGQIDTRAAAGGGGGGGGGAGGGGSGGGGGAGGGGSTSAGDVYIRGGQFLMAGAAQVAAGTTGTNASVATGNVRVDAADARLAGGSQIRTTTTGSGLGGRIALTATGGVIIEGAVPGTGGGTPGGGGGGGGAAAEVAAARALRTRTPRACCRTLRRARPAPAAKSRSLRIASRFATARCSRPRRSAAARRATSCSTRQSASR